jgi:hypothetical protein
MSQENVEIVRREYAAFAARDWEALADLGDAERLVLKIRDGSPVGFAGFARSPRSSTPGPSSTGSFGSRPRRSLKPETRWWPSSGMPRGG